MVLLSWGIIMTVENINISSAIEKVRKLLKGDKSISPGLVAAVELLITVVTILLNQKNLNSRNSSKPPSQDPNRTRKGKGRKKRKKKPGGQKGHPGSTLDPVEKPDVIEQILVDRRTLPCGEYIYIGFDKRQVFDINVSLKVTEYQCEILEDQNGNQWVADFPKGVDYQTQYGNEVKAQSVYMSQFQLVPQQRVTDYFNDQMGLALSKASVQNFNRVAYKGLELFELWTKKTLLDSPLNFADETGVNVNGKRFWFHLLSNHKVALYQVDEKRGSEAMDRMGILPNYTGILVHDHWKPYYRYDCTHSLCNAHHLRELQRAWEQDGQKWAKKMIDLLEKINIKVKKSKKSRLTKSQIKHYQKRYRTILSWGEKECPAVAPNGKKGRTKQLKSRNLLNRLRDFENDVLRFMKESLVPFTNNVAENDLRMTKVQQKISGCFRSLDGAKIFCRIRSYLVTCRKNGVSPTEALRLLFRGQLPNFVT
jgi:transposase